MPQLHPELQIPFSRHPPSGQPQAWLLRNTLRGDLGQPPQAALRRTVGWEAPWAEAGHLISRQRCISTPASPQINLQTIEENVQVHPCITLAELATDLHATE